MNRLELIKQIKEKKSYLCVGLDSDITKIPEHLLGMEDPVFEFNKAIIDATAPYCVSYKLNTAFYESNGLEGWSSLMKTVAYIPKDFFIIADAKRGDIGNTSTQYAKAFFEKMNCDAITVAPYMGSDSVTPFLSYPNKFAIILGLTSNAGAKDFQLLRIDNTFLYEDVLRRVSEWGTDENLMFVIGATQALELVNVRKILPTHFLLIPGVGAQGGSLEQVHQFGATNDIGLLVNVSRDIIFSDNTTNFATIAGDKAKAYQQQMQNLLDKK
jgi:orotidine-5'-phosphate decarboxylase